MIISPFPLSKGWASWQNACPSACHEGKGRKPIAQPPLNVYFPPVGTASATREWVMGQRRGSCGLYRVPRLLDCLLSLSLWLYRNQTNQAFGACPVFTRASLSPRSSHSPLLTSAAFLISNRPLGPTRVSPETRLATPGAARSVRGHAYSYRHMQCGALRCGDSASHPRSLLRQVECVWWLAVDVSLGGKGMEYCLEVMRSACRLPPALVSRPPKMSPCH